MTSKNMVTSRKQLIKMHSSLHLYYMSIITIGDTLYIDNMQDRAISTISHTKSDILSARRGGE